jgi:hypothetical protein
VVALEDWFGQGGAVAVCGELDSGGWLLAGWQYETRAEAVAKAAELIDDLPRVALVVGATLQPDPDIIALPQVPQTAGTSVLTRQSLALLRELAGQRRVLWDPTDGFELAAAFERARVVERQTGLVLVGAKRTDLARAASWALLAQAQPRPVPAIH